jgi:hypothetical protein
MTESTEPTVDVPVDREAAAAAIKAQAAAIVDGVYFNLPADIYHAVERISTSFLQKAAVSPGTAWKGSWLDPDKPELDEEATKAQVLGKAYHTARLEPELFPALYCRALDKAEMPKGTVFTGTDMGKALGDLNETKSKAGESVLDQAIRLRAAGFEGTIWQLELDAWEKERAGRVAIPAELFDDIVRDMERIKATGSILAKLTDGAAEVSIFWTDKHGIQMKARIDYLRPDLWVDFKTFANPQGKVLAQALADSFRYNRYHMQSVIYRDAVEHVRTKGLQIIGEAADSERKLIAEIQMRPGELACWYIFQEKGGVPNLLAREVEFFEIPQSTQANHAITDDAARIAEVERVARRRTGLHIRADQDVEHAKSQFMLYSQVYQPGEPWRPIDPEGTFGDIDFSRYWLEGIQ